MPSIIKFVTCTPQSDRQAVMRLNRGWSLIVMVPLSLQAAQSQGRGNLLLYLGWQADARRLDGK